MKLEITLNINMDEELNKLFNIPKDNPKQELPWIYFEKIEHIFSQIIDQHSTYPIPIASTHCRNLIMSRGYKYIGDLVVQPFRKVLSLIDGIGTKTMDNILSVFEEYGICFGTKIDNWEELRPQD